MMRYGVIILLVSFIWAQDACGQISAEELQQRKIEKMTGVHTASETDYRGGSPPEQDCNSALPVCQGTFVQPDAYSGIGDIQEVPSSSCLGSQEKNSVWYIFTVQTAGTLEFTIDPNVNSDDYDFAVYDLTGANCSDIITGVAPEVRCNYCVDPGNTGVSQSGLNPSEPCCDYSGCQFSSIMNVNSGETYVLTVSNFTSSNSGYTLTFGGTAEIFDETPPEPASMLTPCGVDFMNMDMNEPILCSSLASDGSEFTLTGPGGPFTIDGAEGVNCGTATAQLILDVAPPVIIGETYVLTINNGTDANTLIDNCGNEMPEGTTFEFVAVPNPAEITGPGQVCSGSPVTLTATTGLMYEWSNGETTQSITVSPTEETTYDVTVTSGTCVQAASRTVTVKPSPIADFTFSPDTPCEDQSVSFTNNSTFLMSCLGLGVDFCTDNSDCSPLPCLDNLTTISFNFGDGGSSAQANPNYTYATPGTYNVTLTLTDIFVGCSNEFVLPITILPDGGALNVPGPQEICVGESATIRVSGGSTYTWTSDPPGFSSTDGEITVSPTSTTTYTVVTPGCTGDLSESVTVTVNPLPDVDAGPDESTCLGSSVTLTATGASAYSWSPSTGLNVTTGPTVEAGPLGTTTYTVTGIDANGCENTASVEVEIVDELNAEITADGPTTICDDPKGIDINLDAGEGFDSYMWSTGDTDRVINVNSEGVYIVTVSDGSGCIGIDTVIVEVVEPPDADAGDDTDICSGDEIMLTATGGQDYSWSPATGLDDANSATPIASPTETTLYEVTVSVGECVDMSDILITVLPLPIVEAGTDASIVAGESVELSASGGYEYSWSPTAGLSDPDIDNPIASPEVTTTYVVTVTDMDGCSSTAEVTITVDDSECPLASLYIPNAFSPNGDGQNDVLYVRLQDNVDRFDFKVFNRWGEQVFGSGDRNIGWDGMYDGKMQTTGVFAYFLEVQCGEEIKQAKGNVTIVR